MPCDESPSQNFICKYLHMPPFSQAGSGSISQLYGVGGGVNPSATPIVHVSTSLTHCSAVGCSDCHGASEGHPCLSCDLEPHHQGVSFICCVPAAVKGYCDWLFCRWERGGEEELCYVCVCVYVCACIVYMCVCCACVCVHTHALTHCHCQYTHTMSMLVHDTAYVTYAYACICTVNIPSTCVIIIHLIHTCYLCDTTCTWTLYTPSKQQES